MHARHRYAVITACATFLLLIAGGLVTSTDSGLAVPDWPLSYGTWFPPMVGGIFYEHGHRMIAATVGLLILILAVWFGRSEPRRWVRRLAYAALGAVILQGLLGGLTVLLLLPPAVSILHACLGQTVFCLVVSLAVCTSPHWVQGTTDANRPSHLRRLGPLVAVVAYGQLVLGAVVRHTGLALLPHMATAAVLVALVLLLAQQSLQHPTAPAVLRAGSWRLLLLVVGQAALGLTVLAHRSRVDVRTGHVALGALVLAQAVVLVWEIFRRPSAGSLGASG